MSTPIPRLFARTAGMLVAATLAIWISDGSKAASPPVGTDAVVTIDEDTAYTIRAADFGFTDPDDSPPHDFTRVKLTTLPTQGMLTVDGLPVNQGDSVSIRPVAGIAWTSGMSGRNWWKVASSADGRRLVAVQHEGQIFTSANAGESWTARENARPWVSVASSADGTKLAAVVRDGLIYTSSDSGETWMPRASNRTWLDIASSADGTKLVAVVNGGKIYTSSDSGVVWTERENIRQWVGVASSADGSRLVAFASGDRVYQSMNSGETWAARGFATNWRGVASSADGAQLFGVGDAGGIYRSLDFGISWKTVLLPQRAWQAVACSADGSTIAAVDRGDGGTPGRIYVSNDFGETWTPRGLSRFWRSVASSADGTCLVALEGENYGYLSEIHRSTATIPHLVFTPAADTFGQPYTTFTFQVGDDGEPVRDLDPTPNEFTLNVTAVNDAPVTTGPLPDQAPIKGSPFSFQVPSNAFTDADPGTILSFSATWQDGGALPPWIAFNPATRTFSGTPGEADEGAFRIVVTATDDGSPALSGDTYFYLRISTDAPAGTDGTITIEEDMPYPIREEDYGLTDPNDMVPNRFAGITLTSLPAAGTLTIEGSPVAVGSFVSGFPESELNWTPLGPSGDWVAVASSADGTKLVAVESRSGDLGALYISADSGATWTTREEARRWRAVASSADGTRLVAVAAGSPIYTSSDSGETWTPREAWTPRAEALNWSAVASSADGSRLAATVFQGQIYLSSDFGETWTAVADHESWSSIASSDDGSRLIAADGNGYLHVSTDWGVSWSPRESPRTWRAVASSADGQKLVAVGGNSGGFPGRIFTSTDGGTTWTPREEARVWTGVASSSDGSKLVAVASGGRIYASRDSGVTWLARESEKSWSCCASSSDGKKLIAGSLFPGKLYTSVEAVPELVFTPSRNAFGTPFTSFDFQVEDDGVGSLTRDPTPNTLTFNVVSINDAPTVTTPIPDQETVERSAFIFQFPGNTFSDVESGNALTYSARQADDAPLPGWLHFLPSTRTFSGTPGPGDTGRLELKVIAADDGTPPMEGVEFFSLSVDNIDDAPSGSDGSRALSNRPSYLLRAGDFGFTDPGDVPANRFTRVKLTTLPDFGFLTVDGQPAVVGQLAAIAPAALGSRWTPVESPNNWSAIDSSKDGTKLVAVTNIGRIQTSSDAGATWTTRESARAWWAVTSDAEGINLAAVVRGGRIYVSHDSGVTWTPRASSSHTWASIASSSDGSKLAAVNSSGIQLSTDFGVTWTSNWDSRNWFSICSSADGTRLAAVVWNGQIFTSADSGATWSARESRRWWWSIASSADGSKLAAVVENGRIYTSIDFGLTWTARESNRDWYGIASSADGMTLAAIVDGGRIYISTDAGVTWKPCEGIRDWKGVTVAADGRTVAAAGSLSRIYLSRPLPGQALVYTPDPNAPSVPSTSFDFQVEDDGTPGSNLDESSNRFTLLFQPTPFERWASDNGLPSDPAADGGLNLIRFANGLVPKGGPLGAIAIADGSIIRRGLPTLASVPPLAEGEFGALFGRRKNSGLVYEVQFSINLREWEESQAEPVILASDGVMEACLVRFPRLLANGQPPQYFRIAVADP